MYPLPGAAPALLIVAIGPQKEVPYKLLCLHVRTLHPLHSVSFCLPREGDCSAGEAKGSYGVLCRQGGAHLLVMYVRPYCISLISSSPGLLFLSSYWGGEATIQGGRLFLVVAV